MSYFISLEPGSLFCRHSLGAEAHVKSQPAHPGQNIFSFQSVHTCTTHQAVLLHTDAALQDPGHMLESLGYKRTFP